MIIQFSPETLWEVAEELYQKADLARDLGMEDVAESLEERGNIALIVRNEITCVRIGGKFPTELMEEPHIIPLNPKLMQYPEGYPARQ